MGEVQRGTLIIGGGFKGRFLEQWRFFDHGLRLFGCAVPFVDRHDHIIPVVDADRLLPCLIPLVFLPLLLKVPETLVHHPVVAQVHGGWRHLSGLEAGEVGTIDRIGHWPALRCEGKQVLEVFHVMRLDIAWLHPADHVQHRVRRGMFRVPVVTGPALHVKRGVRSVHPGWSGTLAMGASSMPIPSISSGMPTRSSVPMYSRGIT
jgi:hypothetical protein